MNQDPRRLGDDPADPELARALRAAQGDVLSPESVARVQASLAAAGIVSAGAAPAAKLFSAALRFRLGLGLGLVALGLAGVAGVAATRDRHPGAEAPSTPTNQAAPEASHAPADPVAAPPPPEETAAPALDAPPASAPATTAARSHPAEGAAPSPREGTLLLEARRALDTDPARALGLVRAHRAEFPQSQLGPERARIDAEARRRLNKGGP
jgi:hypothetical protein